MEEGIVFIQQHAVTHHRHGQEEKTNVWLRRENAYTRTSTAKQHDIDDTYIGKMSTKKRQSASSRQKPP